MGTTTRITARSYDDGMKNLNKSRRRESEDSLCTELSSSTLILDDSMGDSTEEVDVLSSASSDLEAEAEKAIIASSSVAVEAPKAASSSPRSVRFSTVEIRSYPIILGDNPSVTRGVPLTIDWIHDEKVVCDVEDYETRRPQRRYGNELLVPAMIRSRLAMETGASRKELQQQQKQCNIKRNQRRRTLERQQLDKLEEVVEKAWRVLSGKKQREKRFIQSAIAASHYSLLR